MSMAIMLKYCYCIIPGADPASSCKEESNFQNKDDNIFYIFCSSPEEQKVQKLKLLAW